MIPVAPIGAGLGASAGPQAGTRADSTERKAALAFERQLVLQLTKQLADSAKSGDGDGASAAGNAYLDMLPGTLADAVLAGGGLGLADQLAPALTEDAT